MKEFNKMDALKYLVKIGPSYLSEWTEAGMYDILCVVINSDDAETFTKDYLDVLLEQASDN